MQKKKKKACLLKMYYDLFCKDKIGGFYSIFTLYHNYISNDNYLRDLKSMIVKKYIISILYFQHFLLSVSHSVLELNFAGWVPWTSKKILFTGLTFSVSSLMGTVIIADMNLWTTKLSLISFLLIKMSDRSTYPISRLTYRSHIFFP